MENESGDSHLSLMLTEDRNAPMFQEEDHARYLDELVSDMVTMNKLQLERPGVFTHAAYLLSTEVERVWSAIYSNRSHPAPHTHPAGSRELSTAAPAVSPPRVEQPRLTQNSPYNASYNTSYHTVHPHLVTPKLNDVHTPTPLMASTPKHTQQQNNFNSFFPSPTYSNENHSNDRSDSTPQHTMQEKIRIPPNPSENCNFIGRILGPRGISVKQLESETGCQILIRGQGSVKDPRREARLQSQPGWEHLTEPLHVLITAKDPSKERCIDKISTAINSVKHLLTPLNDEHKRRQLVQLAIINGTYRPEEPPME